MIAGRRLGFLLCIAILFSGSALRAQSEAPEHHQITAGYSFLSNSIDGVPGARKPLNGYDAAMAFSQWHGLRFKADFSAFSGTNQGAQQNVWFIMAGGQYGWRFGREYGFVEALMGEAGINRYWLPNKVRGQTASFSTLTGGGLDTGLNRHIAIRVQGDFLYANFNPAVAALPTPVVIYQAVVPGLPNYFARMSAGLVWRF